MRWRINGPAPCLFEMRDRFNINDLPDAPSVGKHFKAPARNALPSRNRQRQRLPLPLSVLYLLSLWTNWKGRSIMHHYLPHAIGIIFVVIVIAVVLAER